VKVNSTILRCIKCHGELNKLEDYLECVDCGQHFPLKDGIPNFYDDVFKSPREEMYQFFDASAESYESKDHQDVLYNFYGRLNLPKEAIPKLNLYFQDALLEMLLPEERVLDVACGTGLFSRGLLEKASEVYGVDLSWGMLHQAREYSTEMKLVRASADELPFKDNSFDLITCFVALHLFDDLDQVLAEMNRVLVNGGMVVGLTYLLTGVWEKEEHRQKFLEPQGIHFFTVDELGEYLERNGFSNYKHQEHQALIFFTAEKV
jgi:ubiquinone/menaquinone biosynthesis C-methylase UbiE